jgi:glycosyltransferase involved in cell wall biosynthesis
MKISFVVLTYNRTDALLTVLKSLSAQCSADHEVLIADDGSKRGEVETLFLNCPSFNCMVRHVWHPDTGFTAAQARNLAAFHAQGDYLVFLDGDCIPNRELVAQHTRLAERNCFVNGSRVLISERLSSRILIGKIDLLKVSPAFWLMAWLRRDSNKLFHVLKWPWRLFRVKPGFLWKGIRSCNFGVWRDDFFKVNGFDETFQGWGHEDADLALRLCHLGLKRKDGFMATEVFHLWHPENARQHESSNKQRVVQRMQTNQVQADRGLRQIEVDSTVKITQLFP